MLNKDFSMDQDFYGQLHKTNKVSKIDYEDQPEITKQILIDNNYHSEQKKNHELISKLNLIFKKNNKQTIDNQKSKTSICLDDYFCDLDLSRPILKCLTKINLYKPSEVQKHCIYDILAGNNVCASSITGSGKTIAYLCPIFERLIHKSKNAKCAIRVLIVAPTKELANQIFEICNDVFCANLEGVTSSIILGGKNNSDFIKKIYNHNSDDILVSTPGKLLEIINHKSVEKFKILKNVEILVFDEIDKLLEESFIDQTCEIFQYCSNQQKQILLFSATLDENVKSFMIDHKLDSNNIVIIDLTSSERFSTQLTQFILKIKSNSEEERDNYILYILKTMIFKTSIIFFPTKIKTQNMFIFLTTLGFDVNQLHGDMNFSERQKVLKDFQNSKFAVLLATDVASRGIDVSSIDLIINYELPKSPQTYIHRVGRTARAGKTGISISLVSDNERSILKNIKKLTKNDFSKIQVDRDTIHNLMDFTKKAKFILNQS